MSCFVVILCRRHDWPLVVCWRPLSKDIHKFLLSKKKKIKEKRERTTVICIWIVLAYENQGGIRKREKTIFDFLGLSVRSLSWWRIGSSSYHFVESQLDSTFNCTSRASMLRALEVRERAMRPKKKLKTNDVKLRENRRLLCYSCRGSRSGHAGA